MRTLHLVGPGQVGRSFLQQLAALPVRGVAVSDSTATVFDRRGLVLDAIVAHRQSFDWRRAQISSWPVVFMTHEVAPSSP